jgi:hypothetical protein
VSAKSGDPADMPARASWRGRPALVPLAYLMGALLLTWRLWADPASRMVAGNPHDGDLFAWFMRYAASAVGHGHLPALVTTGMNAPAGVNLMWNTPVLLPGILLAPVTGLLGPQVSLTVLTTAGFAGSATALYWVLRRWGISRAAAMVAGAVYGFSPAVLQESLSHYNLQLVILPPLIIDAGLRLACGRPGAPWLARAGWLAGIRWPAPLRRLAGLPAPVRTGAWLGLLVAAQVFISEEIALSTAVAGLVMVLVLAVSRPRSVPRRFWPAAAGLLSAVVVALALAGHALLVQFYGPLTQHGAVYPLDYYVNDLSGFITPQGSLLFHTTSSAAAAARYQGGATEYLGYLGWPLIAVLVLAAILAWRQPLARAAAVSCGLLCLFSMGGYPLVDGTTHRGVDLPWHWIEELPVVSTALPDRLSILADGLAAVLLAIAIDEVSSRIGTRRKQLARPDHVPGPDEAAAGADRPAGPALAPGAAPDRAAEGRRPAAARWRAVVAGVAVLACLPLVPRPLSAASTYPLPAAWQGIFAALRLQPGARVLAVPVPINYLTPAIRWYAESGEPADLIGGYFIGPGAADGQPYVDGPGVRPTTFYLDQLWAAGLSPASPYASAAAGADLATGSATGPPVLPAGPSQAQVQQDLASWRPAAVVADAPLSSPLGRYLDQLFGPPAVQFGGMTGWRVTVGS